MYIPNHIYTQHASNHTLSPFYVPRTLYTTPLKKQPIIYLNLLNRYLPLNGFADSLNLSVSVAMVLQRVFALCGPSVVGDMTEEDRTRLRAEWFPPLVRALFRGVNRLFRGQNVAWGGVGSTAGERERASMRVCISHLRCSCSVVAWFPPLNESL